jgi:hypothetical protein
VTNIYSHVIPYNLLTLKSNPPQLHAIVASSRLWSGTHDAEGIYKGPLEHCSFAMKKGGGYRTIGIEYNEYDEYVLLEETHRGGQPPHATLIDTIRD